MHLSCILNWPESLNNVDTKHYHLDARITLKSIWHNEPPEIILSFGPDIVYAGHLFSTETFYIDRTLVAGQYQLTLEFINKKNSDTVDGLDKAVSIEKITFNTIESSRYLLNGIYKPTYPEPWASQQEHLKPLLKSHTYLGWNGKWTLTFDVPVFTWIHQVENLGWIYD